MTFTMELDDSTPLDATDVRAALTSQQADDRVIVDLTHDNGAERRPVAVRNRGG
ncbi:hypothetical protein [Saccharopolyspora phatthalungensis]|uniref:Uncharacterized protein n=1 Tax=Saccharopolyspora phatthalungensis TaxID=664693 RepID=A0A840QK80_9PSEU|nr:hypothetical protein [Saccharopolyspora phatthalungensis]MBB5159675.1 hypothetical protein [Saccharopolyspora phatthalungensis]